MYNYLVSKYKSWKIKLLIWISREFQTTYYTTFIRSVHKILLVKSFKILSYRPFKTWPSSPLLRIISMCFSIILEPPLPHKLFSPYYKEHYLFCENFRQNKHLSKAKIFAKTKFREVFPIFVFLRKGKMHFRANNITYVYPSPSIFTKLCTHPPSFLHRYTLHDGVSCPSKVLKG